MRELKIWHIEEEWIISQSGAKLAKVEGRDILLYDKRTRTDVRISLEELISMADLPRRVDVSQTA